MDPNAPVFIPAGSAMTREVVVAGETLAMLPATMVESLDYLHIKRLGQEAFAFVSPEDTSLVALSSEADSETAADLLDVALSCAALHATCPVSLDKLKELCREQLTSLVHVDRRRLRVDVSGDSTLLLFTNQKDPQGWPITETCKTSLRECFNEAPGGETPPRIHLTAMGGARGPGLDHGSPQISSEDIYDCGECSACLCLHLGVERFVQQ